ncbi:hypothetical protein RRG08_049873 [Elysia crispata]|uniref:Uncharacterized protein n=1 Tax=Elysia crispata TaxID=231223 RepID=A0AAE0XZA2_9GAST|nr:hypothetical protein RRG08_049873 [Elysia crispata]
MCLRSLDLAKFLNSAGLSIALVVVVSDLRDSEDRCHDNINTRELVSPTPISDLSTLRGGCYNFSLIKVEKRARYIGNV